MELPEILRKLSVIVKISSSIILTNSREQILCSKDNIRLENKEIFPPFRSSKCHTVFTQPCSPTFPESNEHISRLMHKMYFN